MRIAAYVLILSTVFIPYRVHSATESSDTREFAIDSALETAARRCLPTSNGTGEKMFACDGEVFDRSLRMYQELKENEGLVAAAIKAKFEPNPVTMSREGWLVTFTKH